MTTIVRKGPAAEIRNPFNLNPARSAATQTTNPPVNREPIVIFKSPALDVDNVWPSPMQRCVGLQPHNLAH